MKIITAKFPGKCAETGAKISRGELMLYDTIYKKCYAIGSNKEKEFSTGVDDEAGDMVQANEDAYFENFCYNNELHEDAAPYEPLLLKKFVCIWYESYGNIISIENAASFIEDAGFSKGDIENISQLKVGQSYQPENEDEMTVVRVSNHFMCTTISGSFREHTEFKSVPSVETTPKRYVHQEFVASIGDLKNGFDLYEKQLYDICENVSNPLNEKYPEEYKEISEEDFQMVLRIGKESAVWDDDIAEGAQATADMQEETNYQNEQKARFEIQHAAAMIKKILVDLAVNDDLPMDINELNTDIFFTCFEKVD